MAQRWSTTRVPLRTLFPYSKNCFALMPVRWLSKDRMPRLTSAASIKAHPKEYASNSHCQELLSLSLPPLFSSLPFKSDYCLCSLIQPVDQLMCVSTIYMQNNSTASNADVSGTFFDAPPPMQAQQSFPCAPTSVVPYAIDNPLDRDSWWATCLPVRTHATLHLVWRDESKSSHKSFVDSRRLFPKGREGTTWMLQSIFKSPIFRVVSDTSRSPRAHPTSDPKVQDQTDLVQILAPSPTNCGTLSKLLHLQEPWFLHLKNGVSISLP